MTRLRTLSSIACRQVTRFCRDESGTTAIEYAMVAAGVGGFIAASIWKLGSHLKTTFYDKLASLFP